MSEGKDKTPGAPGVRDAFSIILESVTTEMTALVLGTKTSSPPSIEAVSGMVRTAVRGAVGMGNNLLSASKAIMMGVLRGAREKNEAALQVVTLAANILIQQTADLGGDLTAATKGLVLGAVASARDVGVEPPRGASFAARGAIEGAAAAGFVTLERVRSALTQPIGGILVALPDP
jgi:hypothetical protein